MDRLDYEKEAWLSGLFFVAGIDEAGRGPLAGPVVAAAVVFDPSLFASGTASRFIGLTDSKALSEKLRDAFYDQLLTCPQVRTGCAIIDSETIDEINILQATWKAMAAAVEQLAPLPELALVDGLPVRGLPCPSKSIVKGDSKSLSIAAASVIAKVTRDRLMVEIDRQFPQYGFARHKGYGTAAHLEAIQRHGPCPHHRKSFRPLADRQPFLPGL